MKKIINSPESIVPDMCSGIVLANNKLSLSSKYKVIRKKEINNSKVTLISGGGSGHEPAHAGFIGKGLLDAAVCGDVFASPSQVQVYNAIRETVSDKGTLLIIKNYSGDMMNFQNAMYMAKEDGFLVDYIKVDDDIAVQDSLYTVGHRGVAGTIFVHKIAGAAAEKGLDLAEVKRIAEKVIANVKSIGFALTSCTVPAKGSPTFDLGDAEMEYGVGIHGEPGIRREKIVCAKTLAERMVESICGELKLTADSDDRAAVLVNGFGATPLMELYVMNKEVIRELSGRGITVTRSHAGNFMTSIDMAGASVSVLLLDNELEELVNAPCESLALNISGDTDDIVYHEFFAENRSNGKVSFEVETPEIYGEIGSELTLENMVYIVDVMSACVIKNEVPFCEADSHAGDGDFGMSVAKGFKQLKSEWYSIVGKSGVTISDFLSACSLVIMEHCGGTSGPIWGSAFRAASKSVVGKRTLSVGDFAAMLQAAVLGIQATGERSFGRGAAVGDKTLVDALAPCADAWESCAAKGSGFKEAFADGAASAVEGAKKTESIVARMGRAGAVGERSLGYPDAGAYGLGVIFTDIVGAIST
jgi:dihydroxyacetone kinase